MATAKPAATAAAPPAAQPRAMSLHLGLNTVSPAACAGWDGWLAACEFDANDMAAIARGHGMKPTVLLGKAATRKAVLATLRSAAQALKAGDFCFFTFSGHGGQVPDTHRDEPDRKDETWCLFDRAALPPSQSPKLFALGPAAAFMKQAPFTV